MTTTTTPPPKSSSRPFIIAMLLMLLVIGGLVVYTLGGDEKPATAQAPVDAAPTVAAIPDQTLPPPPPIASEDAGPATPEAKKKVVAGAGSTFCATCGKCQGTPAANFQSVVRGRASSAQRCYEKALNQQEGLQGKLSVSLCVGVGGGVCGASIANDSLGSPLVSQCVLNIFRATTFPSPKNGCVDAQVPLNFVPQKQ